MGCDGVVSYNLACSGRVREQETFPLYKIDRSLLSRRFPVISGFRISWDSRREPGNRVLGIWLVRERESSDNGSEHSSGTSTPKLVDMEPIRNEKDGRKYKIVTREYMAEGHDGFLAFKGKPFLIDDEGGQLMSGIVRKYLLGGVHHRLCLSQSYCLCFRFSFRQQNGESSGFSLRAPAFEHPGCNCPRAS